MIVLLSTPRRGPRRLVGRWRARAGDAGMTTAEYAVGTVAACAFGAVLFAIVRSDAVRGALTSVIQRALTAAF